MVSGIIKNCDVDFTIFGSCHGTAECGILFAMKAFWIVMGFLVLTGGCGLFTPIEELQRQARERNGSASNDVVVVQAVAEKANPEAKEIETEPPEEEVDYPLVDIASSRLHPRKGDIFRFDGSDLTVFQVIGREKVDALASGFDGFVVGIKSFRKYVDGERVASGYYRYNGRYRYTTKDDFVKTVRVFEELEKE